MYLIVSDYDQTFNMDDITIKFNIKKINEFRKNGNLFMLSTGRDYQSIKGEIQKYNISYDYLSCSDGTSLYDINDNIFLAKLDFEDLRKTEYLKLKYKEIISFFDINSDESKLPEERIIEIKSIYYKKIMSEILLYFDKYLINSDYECRYNSIIVKPKGVSKSTTVEYLEKKLNLSKKDIFTIGDHDNDLEIIRNYNGFSMLWGTKKAKEYSLKNYIIMANLLNDIENKKEEFVKKLRFK